MFSCITIDYYDKNAQDFYKGTVNADMSLWRDEFESYLSANAAILDAGCGSGRDSLAFINHGFNVKACDASKEMCILASKLIDHEVENKCFEDIDYHNEFGGIWACASLLHVSENDLPDVMNKLYIALKNDGVIYASFKYGNGQTVRGERIFTDMTDVSVRKLMENSGFNIVEIGFSMDVRSGREDEKWVNVIGRKVG